MQAFIRISDKQIRIRADVTEPDIVIVLDPGLLTIVNVAAGLKKGGLVVVNCKSIDVIPQSIQNNYRLAYIDALVVAKEVLGVPIVNTTMLGAFIKASGIISLDALQEPVKNRFGKLAEKNLNALKRAYEETVIREAANA